jgi:tRNA 2-selenouridine synthase
VTAALYEAEPDLRVVLLDGYTGVAKTEVLLRLADLGVQTLDLEGLAAHRGSLFGAMPGRPQPSQKGFESALLAALDGLDRTRPVVIEAESSKVGELNLPPMLWKAMAAAPRIELSAPKPERARYLTRAYGHIIADPEALNGLLAKLPIHHGRERLEAWRAWARAGDFDTLALDLIAQHYDPAYERSRRMDGRPRMMVVDLRDLHVATIEDAARRLAGLIDPQRKTRS